MIKLKLDPNKKYKATKKIFFLGFAVLCLNSCNISHKEYNVSFKAIDNGLVTVVTNFYTDKSKISKVVYDNSKVLNASSLSIDNSIDNKVVIADDKNDSYSIWVLNKNWINLTADTKAPKPITEIYGDLKPDSIVVATVKGKSLWIYNGKDWTSLVGAKNQPQSLKRIVNNPSVSSIVILDKNDKIWQYANNKWTNLSNLVNSPNTIKDIYADPGFLAVKDNNLILWILNKDHWVNTNLAIDNIFGHKSLDFLVIKDKNSDLYLYKPKSRVKVTGLDGAPRDVDNVFDYPTPHSMVLKDSSGSLWFYNGIAWKMLTNPNVEPKSVARVFGHPTESSIVIEDNENHDLWVYEGNKWYRQTGGKNQPSNVDLMFMVHQKELQR